MNHGLAFPDEIPTESALLEVLSEPSKSLIEQIGSISGPLVVVGAGGKMGPTLCVLAKRAAELAGHSLSVMALSRFSNEKERSWLESRGVQTRRFDALAESSGDPLPDASHVVYLVGLKFGTGDQPELTWATNTLAPARVAQRYRGVPMVALSTGNVYPMSEVDSQGSTESDPLTPLGEYANAAVARERIFEYVSNQNQSPMALLRLNYALDLRYGILVDLAQSLIKEQAIDLSMSAVNCLWQRDANERILRSLALVEYPIAVYNLTSPEAYPIESLAMELGERLGVAPRFVGSPARNALLSDASKLTRRLGRPETPIESVIRWTADWMGRGGRTLGRPTKFQVRDGVF